MLGNLPSILSGVLVIVAVAAAAWGALKQETLKTVRQSNADLSDRVDILEKAEVRHNAEIVRLVAENVILKANETPVALTAIGKNVQTLQVTLNEHHDAAGKWIKALDAHMVELIAAIKEAKT